VIETAAAAGLTLLPPGERDPTLTSTFGLGELLRAAMDEGATRILIGLGGSATCDGGCGMAQALGARFFDTAGELIPPPIRGGQLTSIARIELDGMDRRLERTTCLAACDVTNPLLGPAGAARVYAPQKGAGPDQVAALEAGLARLAAVMQRDLDSRDLAAAPGAGAAGGLGAGVLAWLHGELRSGIDMVLDAVGFDQRLRRADVCLTAEGKLDRQSASGKAIAGVARRCRRHAAPLLALVGRSELSPAEALELGLSGVIEIGHGLSAETSMRDADRLTAEASERLAAARFHAR